MQLIVRKDYESITVQDLIDEADVGRSTFYAHYSGKDQLLRRGFEQLRAELAATQTGEVEDGDVLAFSSAMFVHAERYKDVYQALVGSRGNSIVLSEIRRVLLEIVEPELESVKTTDIPKELAARFIVDSFQSVLTWWLERRPNLEAWTVDAIFRGLVLPSMNAMQQRA